MLDWTDIIIAGLTMAGTIFGVMAANNKAQAITDLKIEELTREVREHNNFAQRIPIIENEINRLKQYHPIKPE